MNEKNYTNYWYPETFTCAGISDSLVIVHKIWKLLHRHQFIVNYCGNILVYIPRSINALVLFRFLQGAASVTLAQTGSSLVLIYFITSEFASSTLEKQKKSQAASRITGLLVDVGTQDLHNMTCEYEPHNRGIHLEWSQDKERKYVSYMEEFRGAYIFCSENLNSKAMWMIQL
jgi:hypothetical protein